MSRLHRSTGIAICCCVAVLAGCAKKENAAVDTGVAITSSAGSTTTTAPAMVNLADVAGKWNMRSVPATGDTMTTTYVLTATSNTSGWTMTLPGRKPIDLQVKTDGDSIIIAAGPFLSVRRKGVQVTTNNTLRLQGGNLVGTTIAHYKVTTRDSVLTLNTSGSRAQ